MWNRVRQDASRSFAVEPEREGFLGAPLGPGRHTKDARCRPRNSRAVPASNASRVSGRSSGGTRSVGPDTPRPAGTGSPSRGRSAPRRRASADGAGPPASVNQGVDIEPAEVGARIDWVVHRAEVGARPEARFDPPDRARKRPAAVGEADPEPGQALQARRRRSRSRWRARFPPASRRATAASTGHPLPSQHVPRMHKDSRVQLLGCLEHREQRRMVEVPLVHVAADLKHRRARAPGHTFELGDGEVRRLERHGAEASEAPGMRGDGGPRYGRSGGGKSFERVRGLGPVAEHDGHGREHLNPHAVAVARLKPSGGIPTGVGDSPGRTCRRPASGPDGARGARVGQTPVAIARPEVGPALREDVGVDVDLHRGCARRRRAGATGPEPVAAERRHISCKSEATRRRRSSRSRV